MGAFKSWRYHWNRPVPTAIYPRIVWWPSRLEPSWVWFLTQMEFEYYAIVHDETKTLFYRDLHGPLPLAKSLLASYVEKMWHHQRGWWIHRSNYPKQLSHTCPAWNRCPGWLSHSACCSPRKIGVFRLFLVQHHWSCPLYLARLNDIHRHHLVDSVFLKLTYRSTDLVSCWMGLAFPSWV